jgi:hypothetical protein
VLISKAINKTLIGYIGGFTGLFTYYKQLVQNFANGTKTETVLYDQAVNGNVTTGADLSLALTLPNGAVITRITANVLTSVDSASDTTTLTVKVDDANTEEGAGTLVNAATQASLQKGGVVLTTVTTTLKADSVLKLRAGTENLTAGKIRFFIDYYLGYE